MGDFKVVSCGLGLSCRVNFYVWLSWVCIPYAIYKIVKREGIKAHSEVLADVLGRIISNLMIVGGLGGVLHYAHLCGCLVVAICIGLFFTVFNAC